MFLKKKCRQIFIAKVMVAYAVSTLVCSSHCRLTTESLLAERYVEQKKAYEALAELDDATLLLQVQSDDVSVGVASFWEFVTRQEQQSQNQQQQLAEWVGFVKGRLNVAIPISWETAVLTASFREFGMVFFDVKEPELDKASKLDIRIPLQSSIKRIENDYLIEQDNTSVRIPAAHIDDLNNKKVSNVVSEEGCTYLTVYDPVDSNYYLLATTNDTLSWKSTVVVGQTGLATSGPRRQHVSRVVLDSKFVYVFGVATNVCYVSAFNQMSGELEFRFTSAWSVEY